MKITEINPFIAHIETIIQWRIQHPETRFSKAPQFNVKDYQTSYLGKYLSSQEFTQQELIIILMALLPLVAPNMLYTLVKNDKSSVLHLNCYQSPNSQKLLPTGQTLAWLIGGNNVNKSLKVNTYFSQTHHFFKKHIIFLGAALDTHIPMSGLLHIHLDFYNQIVLGKTELPEFSKTFPAELIETPLQWSDLILQNETLKQVQNIKQWYDTRSILTEQWNMASRIKPGYRVLFFGEPGTGKTMAASLLGKYTNKPVFRVDVSMLVSKYIGETEKHLANLFDKAEDKDWILFFDEADAIFGKRTDVKDSHDRYANQEISYLLQRIETFPGLVILASNFKNNMDKAFMRRFHVTVRFNKPNYDERLSIWKINLPQQLDMSKINLEDIANKYDELTGANIVNIIQDISIRTIAANASTYTVSPEEFKQCIKREYDKEDKIFPRN